VCNEKDQSEGIELAPPATETELIGDFNSEDLKGVSIMKVKTWLKCPLRMQPIGLKFVQSGESAQNDEPAVAPGFILKQMSRSVTLLGTHN